MIWKPSTLFLLALTSVPSTLATDCNGSGLCHPSQGYCPPDTMAQMHGYMQTAINNGHGTAHYNGGQHIACVGACCGFFQNGASGTLTDAYNALGVIQGSGCKICGSTSKNGGLFTVNYVVPTGCQGRAYWSGHGPAGGSGDGCCSNV